jgi:tetratricopeptide (TPR) repeat protein
LFQLHFNPLFKTNDIAMYIKKLLSIICMLLTTAAYAAEQDKAHFAQARAYLSKGERAKAVEEFGKAIAIRGDVAEYYARRGHTLVELNDLAAALKDFDQALRLDPSHGGAAFDRGMLMLAQGSHLKAVADIDLAARLRPYNARILGGRCVALVAAGQVENGMSDCNRAVSLEKGRDNGYTARGQAYLLLKRSGDALADFESALRINPNHMRALYGRGLALRQLSEADLQQAVQRLPGAGREFGGKVGS